jgi:hypothetical protein
VLSFLFIWLKISISQNKTSSSNVTVGMPFYDQAILSSDRWSSSRIPSCSECIEAMFYRAWGEAVCTFGTPMRLAISSFRSIPLCLVSFVSRKSDRLSARSDSTKEARCGPIRLAVAVRRRYVKTCAGWILADRSQRHGTSIPQIHGGPRSVPRW